MKSSGHCGPLHSLREPKPQSHLTPKPPTSPSSNLVTTQIPENMWVPIPKLSPASFYVLALPQAQGVVGKGWSPV